MADFSPLTDEQRAVLGFEQALRYGDLLAELGEIQYDEDRLDVQRYEAECEMDSIIGEARPEVTEAGSTEKEFTDRDVGTPQQ